MEKEKAGIIAQWLSRQRAHNPLDAISNLLTSRPDDVKDCGRLCNPETETERQRDRETKRQREIEPGVVSYTFEA